MVGIVIGLGAFGHGYSVTKLHRAIDQFPMDPGMYKTLFLVWYFVSGAMVVFGAAIVWSAIRLRAGDAGGLFVARLIGALYLTFGVCAALYKRGDNFWLLFVVLGVLLLLSCFVLGKEGEKPGDFEVRK